MAFAYFITHPDVLIDPAVPIGEWGLSQRGRRRMCALLGQPWVPTLETIWCSTERKAIDAAEMIATAIGKAACRLAELGENDRSATGYLPKDEFEATADAFFANPDASVRGWETAADAQRRIVAALRIALTRTPTDHNVALVSHGGVGALLLCHLKGCQVSRLQDQPGDHGGNYFCVDRQTYSLSHSWLPIDG